jgi:mRNA-degrading endonuclease RelE of RelBE toxin-antitoxin system
VADKIKKVLAKLSAKDREIVKLLILRIKLNDTIGLNISQLNGHTDLYRVKKGRLRIVYRKNKKEFKIIKIDLRNEKTYKDL